MSDAEQIQLYLVSHYRFDNSVHCIPHIKLQNCANRQLYTATYITVKTQMITINSIANYIHIYNRVVAQL